MEDYKSMSFASEAEEAKFWRKKALEIEREMNLVQMEYQEFQESSKDLESELQAELDQTEARAKEFRSLSNRFQMENDHLKSKLQQCQEEYHCQISELQTQLTDITAIKDELHKYVRELEQQNDDLDRAKRSTLASLEDFEARMNATIERNAFLESELDEKESLKESVQRLKDETRDLRAELRVLAAPSRVATPVTNGSVVIAQKRAFSLDSPTCSQSPLHHPVPQSQSGSVDTQAASPNPDNDRAQLNFVNRKSFLERNNNMDSNKLQSKVDGHKKSVGGAPPLTSSTRLSALNIVGDLLRKVGALELKLSSCRNIVKENGANGAGNPPSKLTGAFSPSATNLSSMAANSGTPFSSNSGNKFSITPSSTPSPPGGHQPRKIIPAGAVDLNPNVTDRIGRRRMARIGSTPAVKNLAS